MKQLASLRIVPQLLIISAGAALAEQVPALDDPAASIRTEEVEKAVGPGEMVVLGEHRNFIARARRDESGRIKVQCEQEPPPVVE